MKKEPMKRLLSGILALLLLISCFPLGSFAAEDSLCAHHEKHSDQCLVTAAGEACGHSHTEECYTQSESCVHDHSDCGYQPGAPAAECGHSHDTLCGYTDGTEEAPCTHECGEGCVEACVHAHDEECGYAAAVAQTPCGHLHDELCGYSEGSEETPCDHVCTPDSGCIADVLNCTHSHDEGCGGLILECAYQCNLCPVQGKIDALPDNVTEENHLLLQDQLRETETLLDALTEEELVQLDLSRYQEMKTALEDFLQLQEETEPMDTSAPTEETASTEGAEDEEETLPPAIELQSVLNPLYEGLITEEWLPEPEEPEISFFAAKRYYSSTSSAAAAAREYMVARSTSFDIGYVIHKSKWNNDGVDAILGEIWEKVFIHTGVPVEGDYLDRTWAGMTPELFFDSYASDTNYYNATFRITMKYYTTARQEEIVTSRVNSLLSQLKPSGSDYEKIKTVYDWVCANVEYDYANLENDSYTLKYTPYAALVNKTAVCQGYAILMYRLALEMGMDCRYISGFANGGGHGWNIVRIGEKYYNLDATWDAGNKNYLYFLKCDSDFPYHQRRAEYATESFYKQYPMGQYNYDATARVVITQQPVSVRVDQGSMATVSVAATGIKLNYKWYVAAPGSSKFGLSTTFTGPTYSVEMTSGRNGRRVYCVVSDVFGNLVTSATATMTMRTPLKINTQPASVTVEAGQTAKVTVKAQGDGLTYKWYYAQRNSDDFHLSSVTTSSYSTTMSDSAAGRRVYCIITDEYGNYVQSDTVTLSRKTVAAITGQPASANVELGEKAVITVKAEGDGLNYQWYFANPGKSSFSLTKTFTGPTYSTTMDGTRNGRRVYCVITDKYGNSVKSDIATMTLKTTAKILQQPTDGYADPGKAAKVTFQAQGDGLSYQWYFANSGSDTFKLTTSYKSNSYSVTMDEARSGRRVYCVVTDKYGNSCRTDTVTLRMKQKVQITKQPVSVRAESGTVAQVSFQARGDGLSYTWYFRDPGASKFSKTTTFKSNTYSITMSSARSGRQVYCIVKDIHGNSVRTDTVTLSRKIPLKITKQPASVKVAAGANAVVSLKAQGDGLTYQWYFKNAGETKFRLTTSFKGSSYTTKMDSARSGRQVYCVISDMYGNSVTTETATLSMAEPVKITKQPVSVKVKSGQIAKVTVEAQGEGLSYQWYFANPGKTKFSLTTSYKSNTYSVTMNSTRSGRRVYCVVTDAYGNQARSNTVSLSMK